MYVRSGYLLLRECVLLFYMFFFCLFVFSVSARWPRAWPAASATALPYETPPPRLSMDIRVGLLGNSHIGLQAFPAVLEEALSASIGRCAVLARWMRPEGVWFGGLTGADAADWRRMAGAWGRKPPGAGARGPPTSC